MAYTHVNVMFKFMHNPPPPPTNKHLFYLCVNYLNFGRQLVPSVGCVGAHSLVVVPFYQLHTDMNESNLAHLKAGIVQHELLLLLKVLVHGFRQQEPHDGVISADGWKKDREREIILLLRIWLTIHIMRRLHFNLAS